MAKIANLRSQTPDDADFANARPHQMWLTGDQIYGDDLSDPWLALCIDLRGVAHGESHGAVSQTARAVGPQLAIELPLASGLEATRDRLERSHPLAGFQLPRDRRPGDNWSGMPDSPRTPPIRHRSNRSRRRWPRTTSWRTTISWHSGSSTPPISSATRPCCGRGLRPRRCRTCPTTPLRPHPLTTTSPARARPVRRRHRRRATDPG